MEVRCVRSGAICCFRFVQPLHGDCYIVRCIDIIGGTFRQWHREYTFSELDVWIKGFRGIDAEEFMKTLDLHGVSLESFMKVWRK